MLSNGPPRVTPRTLNNVKCEDALWICPAYNSEDAYVCLDPSSSEYLCDHLLGATLGAESLCETCAEYMDAADRFEIGDGHCDDDKNIEGCLWDGGTSQEHRTCTRRSLNMLAGRNNSIETPIYLSTLSAKIQLVTSRLHSILVSTTRSLSALCGNRQHDRCTATKSSPPLSRRPTISLELQATVASPPANLTARCSPKPAPWPLLRPLRRCLRERLLEAPSRPPSQI